MSTAAASARGPPSGLLLLLALVLLQLMVQPAHAQQGWQALAPTWAPTPAPTPAPLTVDCDLSAYLVAINGTGESCYFCRRDYSCAWCVPDSSSMEPFCFDNRVSKCPGQAGSYALDICTEPMSRGMLLGIFAVIILVPLLCCCGGCFLFAKWRANRKTTVVFAPTSGFPQQRPVSPVMYPPSNGFTPPPNGSYPGSTVYTNPAYSTQPTHYSTNSNYSSNYSNGAANMGPISYSTATQGTQGSVTPPPQYPGTGYGYNGQPTGGGAYM